MCDGAGDPCDALCGGAGCGQCGGSTCSDGAVTKCDEAKELAEKTAKIMAEKEKKLKDMLKAVSLALVSGFWWIISGGNIFIILLAHFFHFIHLSLTTPDPDIIR